jgi:hypothetical protein
MARYHGITENTYKRFVVDAGAVYKNYGETVGEALIGATRDGSTFTIETEYRQIAVDGAKGPVKGGQDITSVVAKISAKFIELSTDLIKTALPGSASADHPEVTPTHDEITRALQIALTDYLTNVAIVGRVSGSNEPIICGIKNALALGGFELAQVDNDEAGITVEFTAHFDPADLDKEPWFIRFPKIV